jgi:hypothetical protein
MCLFDIYQNFVVNQECLQRLQICAYQRCKAVFLSPVTKLPNWTCIFHTSETRMYNTIY